MQVENILQSKGRAVDHRHAPAYHHRRGGQPCSTPRTSVPSSSSTAEVVGILSERDVVRHLGTDWAALADRPVSDVMTKNVTSAAASRRSPT